MKRENQRLEYGKYYVFWNYRTDRLITALCEKSRDPKNKPLKGFDYVFYLPFNHESLEIKIDKRYYNADGINCAHKNRNILYEATKLHIFLS